MPDLFRNLRAVVATADPVFLSDQEGQALCVGFLSELVTLAFPDLALGSISCSILRAPGGSSATFTAGAITPDVVGYYKFTASNGSAPARVVHVVAYPVAAKTDARVALSGRTEAQVRQMLKNYAAEQLRNGRDMTTFDALTTNAPLPASVDWRSFTSGSVDNYR